MEIRSNYMDIMRTNKREDGRYELTLPSLNYCPKCNCAFETTHLKVIYDPEKFKASSIWETISASTECPFCGNPYSKEYRDGGMAEIEEGIFQAIINFNKKGYKSFASCEGHVLVSIDDEDHVLEVGQPYIAFDLSGISSKETIVKNIEKTMEMFKIKGLSVEFIKDRDYIPDSVTLRPEEPIDPECYSKIECVNKVSEFRSGVLELSEKIRFNGSRKSPSRRGGSLSRMVKVDVDISSDGNYYCFNCGNYYKNEMDDVVKLVGEYAVSGKGKIEHGSCKRCSNCKEYHNILFGLPGKVIDRINEIQEEFSEEHLKIKKMMNSPNEKGIFVRFSLDKGEYSVKIVNSRKFRYLDNGDYQFYIPYRIDHQEFLKEFNKIEEVLLDV